VEKDAGKMEQVARRDVIEEAKHDVKAALMQVGFASGSQALLAYNFNRSN